MSQVTIFRKISELMTLEGALKKKAKGLVEEDLGIIKDAAMVSQGGKVVWVGPDKKLTAAQIKKIVPKGNPKEYLYKNYSIIPAFVESHTHSVFAGDRSSEFEMRNSGKTYQEIFEQGGGIQSTVEQTRLASKKVLTELAQNRMNRFVEQGVTCVEVKSGYGLDEKTESKMLKVAAELVGPKIIKTFLGAHAFPKDIDKEEYKSQLLEKMMPKFAKQKLIDRVDIFIEDKYFDCEFGELYFERAKTLGLSIAAHVEQLSHSGGLQLALEHGAQSVEHVVEATDSEISELAKSDTTAVLLPGADFYLSTKYPRARKMLDEGARISLATDFNPGSCPTQDLSFVGILARLEMKMKLFEVISAYTLGASFALGLESERGSLVVDKTCDFSVLDGSWRDLFYKVGHHPVVQTWKEGRKLFGPSKIS